MPSYRHPECAATLRQALGELRSMEGDVSIEVSNSMFDALEAHDAVHVLFGLDISDVDEVVAHGWMIFGTTLTFAEMAATAKEQDHRRFAAGFAGGRRAAVLLRALPGMLRAAWRARHMRKKWPWTGYAAYLDVPLVAIRREFGIVLDAPAPRTRRVRGPHHPPVARGV
jgi:hypothetical protein